MTRKLRAGLAVTALAGLLATAAAGAASQPRLIATVGFGQITLKNERGLTLEKLRAGRYAVAVVDRSATDNFHLLGKGINVRTGIAFQGVKNWNVRFRKGTTVKYYSDHAPRKLKGSFRIR